MLPPCVLKAMQVAVNTCLLDVLTLQALYLVLGSKSTFDREGRQFWGEGVSQPNSQIPHLTLFKQWDLEKHLNLSVL